MGSTLKYWMICPTSDQEADIFIDDARKIYMSLFESEEKTSFDNIRNCISSQYSQNISFSSPFEDFLFVAYRNNKPLGFLYFTVYPKLKSGIITYFGVINSKQNKDIVNEGYSKIISVMKEQGIARVFFETRRESKLLRRFQQLGARIVPCINYIQPSLQDDKTKMLQEIPMYLYYFNTSGTPDKSLTKKQIKEMLKFIYMCFYFDGIKQVILEKTQEIQDYGKYYRQLMIKVASSLPSILNNFAICRKEEKNSLSRKVFVSYPIINEGTEFANTAAFYLDCLGYDVIEWNRKQTSSSTESLNKAIKEWVENCNVVLFIFTNKSGNSPGQFKEIYCSNIFNKDRIIFVHNEMSQKEKEVLRKKVYPELGTQMRIDFDRNNFTTKLIECFEQPNFSPSRE